MAARQVLDTVANPVNLGRFRTASGTRAGVHEPIIDEILFNRCAAAIAKRRTNSKGPRTRCSWSFLERKVRCARCGQLMGIRTAAEGPVVRVYFRCRKAAGGAVPCTGTQVRAHEIEHWFGPSSVSPASLSHGGEGGLPELWLRCIRSASSCPCSIPRASGRWWARWFKKLSGMPTRAGCKPGSNGTR